MAEMTGWQAFSAIFMKIEPLYYRYSLCEWLGFIDLGGQWRQYNGAFSKGLRLVGSNFQSAA
ncbi:hypothetical protein [Spongiibacter sp.]|uniref:hypothetical protein n=1 Tax=Spongiibacter sp. TaxID=2024860 RepID=UPI0035613923